jgi:hypothetical protein
MELKDSMELKDRTAAIIRSLYLDVHPYSDYLRYRDWYIYNGGTSNLDIYWVVTGYLDRTIWRAFSASEF